MIQKKKEKIKYTWHLYTNMYIEQSFLFSYQITMADLDEFGYWWVYDLTPQQLEKYNGPSKKSKKLDKEKTQETKTELTEVLSTNDWLPETDQDTEEDEITSEEKNNEKPLALETKAFRIDTTWWKKERRRYKPSSDHRIEMKVNPEKDVFEYWDKQSFLTYEALIREISKAKWGISKKEIERRYLPTQEKLAFWIGNPQKNNPQWHGRYYSNFYRYNCEHQIRGIWSPGCWHFPMQEGSVSYYLWLAGGKYAYLSDEWWSVRWWGWYKVDLVWASALLFKDNQITKE